MRLAIFGGSFDPPHVGHLLAADDAFDQLALDRLVFVPTAAQPLKVGRAAESLGFAVAIDHAGALLGAPATPTATPPAPGAPGLDSLLRDSPSSESDRMRVQGEQQFARVIEAAARSADQLDAYWERSARTCVASSTTSE